MSRRKLSASESYLQDAIDFRNKTGETLVTQLRLEQALYERVQRLSALDTVGLEVKNDEKLTRTALKVCVQATTDTAALYADAEDEVTHATGEIMLPVD